MKKLKKSFLWLALFFVLGTILIAYAQVSGILIVTGSVKYEEKEYEGIYISDVKIHSQSNVDIVALEYTKPTILTSSVEITGNNPSVTFEITVHNNSDVTYWYHGIASHPDYGDNSMINQADGITIATKDVSSANSPAFNTEDWVPPKSTRTFYATYQFGTNARGEVSTMINYKFGLHLDAVYDDFAAILNNNSSYAYITQLFNDAYNDDGSKIIGNVGEDKQAIESMFGGQPTILVDGVETPVTVMIQRENINKKPNNNSYSGGDPSGCEYTVYFTVEDLKNPGGSVTVYATTYTLGSDGIWYQLGELYEGTAPKMDYNGSEEPYQGAFDLTQWKAVQKRYYIGDRLNYGTGYEHEQFNKQTSFADIINVDDTNFCNNINNELKSTLLLPACNTVYSYRHNNSTGGYDEFIDTDNSHKPGYDQLKVAYDRIAQYCYSNSNGGTDVRIRHDSGLTRAELIYMVEQLLNAYEYYCQVNPNT